MSEDLLRKLQILQEDYVSQPLVARQLDLLEINQIRSQLGMPFVDADLDEIGAGAVEVEAKPEPEPTVVQDHTEAREIYEAYRKKIAELEVHWAYAEQVADATAGDSQTPVRPLATMGTDGGPLRCDQCGKPIVLEGGHLHGLAADAAWKLNPDDNWTSWILGGMVVEIQTNGTLRVYHGYPRRDITHCCNLANWQDAQARAQFDSSKGTEKQNMILAFVEQEFPAMTTEEHLDLLSKIMDTIYSYDPGIGINRPSTGA